MATNLDRFRADLDKLVTLGHRLEISMMREITGNEDFLKSIREKLDKKKYKGFIDGLPNFRTKYEEWYSEGLALLRQLLPDRVGNFISLYEKPKTRKEISYGNYVIQDYMQGLQVTSFGGEIKVATSAALPQFRQQLAILEAAKKRFDSSLFEIRQLVQADLMDSEIDAARELLKRGFARAAGALAGVVLEKHLAQVCLNHKIVVSKKNATINDLNELLKASNAIDTAQWRHISLLGDLRNLCSHKKEKEPTTEQVTDLVDGVVKIIKTVS